MLVDDEFHRYLLNELQAAYNLVLPLLTTRTPLEGIVNEIGRLLSADDIRGSLLV